MSQNTINVDEYLQAKNKLLEQMANDESQIIMTKKECILKLKDIERPLILAGYYPDLKLNDLCSHIGETLEKYNISYARTKLPLLFEDDEKRTQHNPNGNLTNGEDGNSPPLETEKTKREEEGIIGQIDYLEKQIGKSYDVMESDDGADRLQLYQNMASKLLSHFKTEDKIYKTSNYFVDIVEKTFGTIEEAEKALDGLPKKQRERLHYIITKYNADVLLITEMQEAIFDTRPDDLKEIQVVQEMTSKDLDQRSKLTNWEKLMIVLAMKAGGIAKNQCAKLNDIDKKHITNNIYPEESPVEPYGTNKHHDYLSWFKAIKIDGKVFDISRWFDEQIIRKKLGLEFKPLVTATAKVQD